MLCMLGVCLLTSVVTWAEEVTLTSMPPVVVQTIPGVGASAVDPQLREITVKFSQEIQDGAWSWVRFSPESFPTMAGQPRYLPDKRTCVLPVTLEPGKTYALWVDSEQFTHLKSTTGRAAVRPCWCFRPAAFVLNPSRSLA